VAMQLDSNDMTFGGFIATWLGIIFGIGKTYGKLDSKVVEHSEEIKEIQDSLKDPSGGPKYLTKPEHDRLQEDCQLLMRHRLDTLDKRMGIHDEKLDKVLAGVSELQGRGHKSD